MIKTRKRTRWFQLVTRLLLVMALVISSLTIPIQTSAASISANRKAVLKLVNQQRKKRNQKKLVLDSKLNKAAQKRAKEISQEFSHTRPNGDDCFTILMTYKAKYTTCGENIAAGQSTAKQVMNSWMHSSGHKKNILGKKYRKMGVGYYKKKGTSYTYYWVQLFTD